jgi:hypothetical protein
VQPEDAVFGTLEVVGWPVVTQWLHDAWASRPTAHAARPGRSRAILTMDKILVNVIEATERPYGTGTNCCARSARNSSPALARCPETAAEAAGRSSSIARL